MSEKFEPTEAQHNVCGILVGLIGMSGVHRRPEQGESIVLDLLPAGHTVFAEPFCVRVAPDGTMERITDEDAGLGERPTIEDALMEQMASNERLIKRLAAKHASDVD